jgi:hypothetical protein
MGLVDLPIHRLHSLPKEKERERKGRFGGIRRGSSTAPSPLSLPPTNKNTEKLFFLILLSIDDGGQFLGVCFLLFLGGQYFLPFARNNINNLIEKAILDADRAGVKVLSLAALNKVSN